MAKRELSSTLKNLKFMQRTAPKERKIEEVEIREPEGSVFATGASVSAASRRCIVIFEGDPHPGALRGRISFQNFNPSIDKLNEEAATIHQNPTSIPPKENGNISNRSEKSKASNQENSLDADLKRKQPLEESETPDLNKFQKTETPGSSKRSPDLNKFQKTETRGSSKRSPDLNKFQKTETRGSSKKSPSHHPDSSNSQNKREKMDWNLLRRQEARKKRT